MIEDLPPEPGETAAPEMDDAEPRLFKLTDAGNAERLAHYSRGRLAWTEEVGWRVYDGRRWVGSSSGALVSEVAISVMRHAIPMEIQIASELGDPEEEFDPEAWKKHLARSESASGLHAMISLARAKCMVPSARFDADPMLLNVQNGTLDLRTGRLRPHNPDDFITQITTVAWVPGHHEAPHWEDFITWMGCERDELVAYLQRVAGYCLTGDVSEQIMPILHGDGANGKSVFAEVLQGVLGEYAAPGAPGLVMMKDGTDHPTAVAGMRGRRLVVVSETQENARLDESRVKQLTGDETLSARFMGKDFFTFKPTAKILVLTNPRPVVSGSDYAIWRRIHLVPCEATVDRDKRDGKLTAKLLAEAEGILVWMVQGCLAWQRDGLRPPELVTEAVDTYQREMDALGDWLEDRCKVGAGLWDSSESLYRSFHSYIVDRGERPMGMKGWTNRMKRRGFMPAKSSDRTQRGWQGVQTRLTASGN